MTINQPQAEAAINNQEHELVSKKTYTKTIKEQDQEDAMAELATMFLSGGAVKVGLTTVPKALAVLGGAKTVKEVFVGGKSNTYPLEIREYVYKVKDFEITPSTTYYGYAIYDIFNKSTGKKIRSKQITIGKTAI